MITLEFIYLGNFILNDLNSRKEKLLEGTAFSHW